MAQAVRGALLGESPYVSSALHAERVICANVTKLVDRNSQAIGSGQGSTGYHSWFQS